MSHSRPSPPRRWVLRQPPQEVVKGLQDGARIENTLAVLLANRGWTDPEAVAEHLRPDLKRLHDPALLPGMAAAQERLARAIEANEMILVHGDYDVDGVTGTALLVRLFRHLGARVSWHIPNRFTDGYSFGDHSIERVRETGAKLVISVDNGTSAVETITQLAELGVDTIVTDHHEPPLGVLPPAVAIVNPKLEDSAYPFRELCGGAVAFKLAWGVCQAVSGAERVRADLRDFLVDAMGYVAIATVCDVVPLVDENRVLAHFGLRALEHARQPGIRALLEVARLTNRRLGAEDVGFQIGPRINASGRIDSAARAVEVLLAEELAPAREHARRLDELNRTRKELERELLVSARAEARRFDDPEQWPVTVVAGQGWHQGVVGIAAARLVDEFQRPAIVVGLEGESGRGSARTIPGFDILEAMHAAAPHFERYGGHASAAGCEVRADAIDSVREAVCARARELLADGDGADRPLEIDAELPLSEVTERLMADLDRLEPYGEQNEKPIFLSRGLRLAEPPRVIGQDRTHLLLRLRRGETVLKAMAFGAAHREGELAMGQPLDVVYTPRWNYFRGEQTLELVALDFQTPGISG